jgi:hypothetical protein
MSCVARCYIAIPRCKPQDRLEHPLRWRLADRQTCARNANLCFCQVSGVRMQFGKVTGLGLFVLGFILLLVQFVIVTGARRDEGKDVRDTTPTVENNLSYAPGVIGGLFLLGGIWVIYTSRRADEPPVERAVK